MSAFLIVSAVAAVWAGTLLVHPFGKCPLCRGKRVRVRGRRARRCGWCKGRGRVQRPGSRQVHQVRRLAVRGWQGRRDG